MAGQRFQQQRRPSAIKNTCRHSSLAGQLAEILSGASHPTPRQKLCSALYGVLFPRLLRQRKNAVHLRDFMSVNSLIYHKNKT
jgi:hypothetical protein